jgi:phosphatidylglycerol:prolipoprotein diacylglycerol transferase
MGLLSITFPDINPVAVQFGPFAVKWYGLAYMAGLLLGWFYVK